VDITRHRLLDSQFILHSAFGDAWFFDRIARSYEPGVAPLADPAVTSTIEIRVHHASAAELHQASAGWPRCAHFHRSLNYAHWNLDGPADTASIHLPGEGVLFRYHATPARLDAHIDPMHTARASELIFHAARNLALWRRGPRFAPMLHASAVLVDGAAWLFLGGKGAGKSTLFIDAVLRQGAQPLSNDRVLLDAEDGRSVWSWPSYLSYCEGTILDYPELRHVFDAGLRDLQRRRDETGRGCAHALYRRSYAQAHKRIVAPCLLTEVLGLRYQRRAPLAGIVRARLEPGHAAGLTLHASGSTAQLQAADIADAVFPPADPDFPCWHGDDRALGQRAAPGDAALAWLQAAGVRHLDVTLDPVGAKPRLHELLAARSLT